MKKIAFSLIIFNMALLLGCIYIIMDNFEDESSYVAIADLPEDYSVEDAIQDGCVVIQKDRYQNKVIAGQGTLYYFIEDRVQEKFMRLVICDGQSLDIRDYQYKNGKYYVETKELQEVYIFFYQNKKTTYSYQNKKWVDYEFVFVNDSSQEIVSDTQTFTFSTLQLEYINNQKDIREIEKEQYTPEMARKDGCVVIEDEKIKDYVSFVIGARIAIYEDGVLTSLGDLECVYRNGQMAYNTYSYVTEEGELVKEQYSFYYRFQDVERQGTVIVLSNKELTYEIWDRCYRDGMQGQIKNLLFYSYENVTGGQNYER